MTPTESEEQSFVVSWARAMSLTRPELGLLFHVPNGGSRHLLEAVHLKRAGVMSGVPDLVLPVPRGQWHGLFIELKAENGRVSDNQGVWLEQLRRQGYCALVAWGATAAIEFIDAYLKGEILGGNHEQSGNGSSESDREHEEPAAGHRQGDRGPRHPLR